MENKITQEELENLKNNEATKQQLVTSMGVVNFQLMTLEKHKLEIYTKMEELELEKVELDKKLVEKYGSDITINPETGEIITEETDKQ